MFSRRASLATRYEKFKVRFFCVENFACVSFESFLFWMECVPNFPLFILWPSDWNQCCSRFFIIFYSWVFWSVLWWDFYLHVLNLPNFCKHALYIFLKESWWKVSLNDIFVRFQNKYVIIFSWSRKRTWVYSIELGVPKKCRAHVWNGFISKKFF